MRWSLFRLDMQIIPFCVFGNFFQLLSSQGSLNNIVSARGWEGTGTWWCKCVPHGNCSVHKPKNGNADHTQQQLCDCIRNANSCSSLKNNRCKSKVCNHGRRKQRGGANCISLKLSWMWTIWVSCSLLVQVHKINLALWSCWMDFTKKTQQMWKSQNNWSVGIFQFLACFRQKESAEGRSFIHLITAMKRTFRFRQVLNAGGCFSQTLFRKNLRVSMGAAAACTFAATVFPLDTWLSFWKNGY